MAEISPRRSRKSTCVNSTEAVIVKTVKRLKDKVRKCGYPQYDKPFNRSIQHLPGHFIVVKKEDVEWLKVSDLPKECKDDWNRIIGQVNCLAPEIRKNPDSRQILFHNLKNFNTVHQCFNLFQFVMTHRGEYDMYVYQRSFDLAKAYKDFRFFGFLMRYFEGKTKHSVTKLVVVYGDVHYELPA